MRATQPSAERSLEAFINKANETLADMASVDVSGFDSEKREQQLREEIAALQAKLAHFEALARAASEEAPAEVPKPRWPAIAAAFGVGCAITFAVLFVTKKPDSTSVQPEPATVLYQALPSTPQAPSAARPTSPPATPSLATPPPATPLATAPPATPPPATPSQPATPSLATPPATPPPATLPSETPPATKHATVTKPPPRRPAKTPPVQPQPATEKPQPEKPVGEDGLYNPF